ncbi:MAG: hypothetical protein JSU61_06080, partial [Fidelibacterota bacterium]
MKKAVLFSTLVCCLTSAGIAQTMVLAPHGVSPHDAEISEVDIFDLTYNGLLNVGVGTQMYLRGFFDDSTLSGAATWTILSAPTSSVATVGVTTVDLDTATQVTTFTPDLVGTYKVIFAEGLFADTVTINAGTYTGIDAGNCALCHDDAGDDFKVTAWEGTGHYSLFEDGMNGIASDHYSSNCISCHTTGYDTNADNGGFDDITQTVEYLEKDTTFV